MKLKETNQVLNKFAKYVVQQSKSNLTKDGKGGGSLYKSIGYDLDKGINILSTVVGDNVIEIRSVPKSMDISAERSVFLNIDLSKSNIQTVIDTEVG